MSNYPIQERINQHAKLIFYVIGIVQILCYMLAIWTKDYWIALVPLVGIFALIFTVQPTWLYFVFIAIIPFSFEFEIGSFGTDLPSEPILIGFAFLSALWLINNFKEQSKNIFYNPIVIGLLLHLFWVYFSIFFSADKAISIKYALSKSWYLVGHVIGTFWIIKNSERFKVAIIILVFSTVATISIVMVEHGLEGFTFDSIGAACNPLYRNHVNYGVFIVMVLPFAFILRLHTRKQSIHRLIMDIVILLYLAGIYFSYTRGAWLAIPVMFIVWYCVRRRLLRFLFPLGVLAGILFFAYLSHDYKYLKYAPQFENTIYHEDLGEHLSATFEGKDMSTMERFHRWIAAFRIFRENPIVGIGPNAFVENYKSYTSPNFETYISDNDERSTVHNYFILTLAEQGSVGFIILIFFVGAYFIYGERKYHTIRDPYYQKNYLACLLCGAAFWLNNLFSDLLEANKVAPLWFFTIAWMLRIQMWDNKKPPTQ